MQRLYVLYDARCGLCRWARQWLDGCEKLVELEFLAAESETARRLFPTLTTSKIPEELVVVSDQGGVYRGGHAWIMCLYALEDYREWSIRLATPALLPLARQGFAMLSKQRGKLSRWLGLASENEIVKALEQVAAPACELVASNPSTMSHLLAKHVEREVKRGVPLPIREQTTLVILDEHGRPFGDPVDRAHTWDTVHVEDHPSTDAEGVRFVGDLAWGDQVVDHADVTKDVSG